MSKTTQENEDDEEMSALQSSNEEPGGSATVDNMQNLSDTNFMANINKLLDSDDDEMDEIIAPDLVKEKRASVGNLKPELNTSITPAAPVKEKGSKKLSMRIPLGVLENKNERIPNNIQSAVSIDNFCLTPDFVINEFPIDKQLLQQADVRWRNIISEEQPKSLFGDEEVDVCSGNLGAVVGRMTRRRQYLLPDTNVVAKLRKEKPAKDSNSEKRTTSKIANNTEELNMTKESSLISEKSLVKDKHSSKEASSSNASDFYKRNIALKVGADESQHEQFKQKSENVVVGRITRRRQYHLPDTNVIPKLRKEKPAKDSNSEKRTTSKIARNTKELNMTKESSFISEKSLVKDLHFSKEASSSNASEFSKRKIVLKVEASTDFRQLNGSCNEVVLEKKISRRKEIIEKPSRTKDKSPSELSSSLPRRRKTKSDNIHLVSEPQPQPRVTRLRSKLYSETVAKKSPFKGNHETQQKEDARTTSSVKVDTLVQKSDLKDSDGKVKGKVCKSTRRIKKSDNIQAVIETKPQPRITRLRSKLYSEAVTTKSTFKGNQEPDKMEDTRSTSYVKADTSVQTIDIRNSDCKAKSKSLVSTRKIKKSNNIQVVTEPKPQPRITRLRSKLDSETIDLQNSKNLDSTNRAKKRK